MLVVLRMPDMNTVLETLRHDGGESHDWGSLFFISLVLLNRSEKDKNFHASEFKMTKSVSRFPC